MQTNLPQALSYITTDEGPEVNISPDEPGGASKWGVTLVDLSEYRKTVCTVADVQALTQDDANAIYSLKFAGPIQFGVLPSGVDYRMLDVAVTLGVAGSITLAQMALLIWPVTGALDANTLAKIQAADPKVFLPALDAAWLAWKHNMTTDGWSKYAHGWVNRVIKVRNRYALMIGVTS